MKEEEQNNKIICAESKSSARRDHEFGLEMRN